MREGGTVSTRQAMVSTRDNARLSMLFTSFSPFTWGFFLHPETGKGGPRFGAEKKHIYTKYTMNRQVLQP